MSTEQKQDGRRRLTEDMVAEIRELHATGLSQAKISQATKISQTSISAILSGKRHADVKNDSSLSKEEWQRIQQIEKLSAELPGLRVEHSVFLATKLPEVASELLSLMRVA